MITLISSSFGIRLVLRPHGRGLGLRERSGLVGIEVDTEGRTPRQVAGQIDRYLPMPPQS